MLYYDNRPIESGSFSNDILSASGGLSLYEYNVDRQGELSWSDRGDEDSWTDSAGTNRLITPYVLKSSSKQYLKSKRRTRTIVEGPAGTNTIIASGPMQEVSDDYVKAANTDVLTGSSYVMSASITRELMVDAGNLGSITNVSRSANPHYRSLRNSLNFYGTRSPHYFVEFSASNIGQYQARLSISQVLCYRYISWRTTRHQV
jgi:hypothetical protein